jgi:transposase
MTISGKRGDGAQDLGAGRSRGEGGSPWRGGERSEPDRNGEPPSPRLMGNDEKTLTQTNRRSSAPDRPDRPDPEVREGPIRRRFSAEYKQRILAEADVCSQSGQVGALLRREGLYSSLLSTWRRQREAAVAEGLAPRKRGRKPSRDPQAERIARLERENARLKRDIEEAKIIIDIQKKTSQLLGIKLTDVSDHEKILYGEPNE